ncbi:MAG: very short patch repair endonuclease [Coriobacteriia bacterium]|nr:very short patch repair endonuclease [Coriobacteriia bacterium]
MIDAARRSRNMAAIRRRDTAIERALRSAIWSAGLRGYRVDSAKIPGRPDVSFGRAHVAVFVDGCFWHRCPQCYREPKSNTDYWRDKIERNVARDRTVDEKLLESGWTVIRLWEHEVERDLGECVAHVAKAVRRC